MEKSVRKVRHIQLEDLAMAETYFRDMAAEGLILEDIGIFFYSFRRTEPQILQYRIECLADGCSQEQADLYQTGGWQYVCEERDFYVFCGEAGAEEPHTQPEEQMFFWEEKLRQVKSNAISSIFCGLFIIGSRLLLFDAVGTKSMAKEIFVSLSLIFAWLILIYIGGRRWYKVKKLKEQLALGIPMHHEEPWQRQQALTRIAWWSAVVVLTILAIGNWFF